jgi:hypothetical protein
MSTHAGSVRSFDLGGPGASGRRWCARCECGVLATTGAWDEALAFLTAHLRATARPRATWSAGRLSPDLRSVDCWQSAVVRRNGNGHAQPATNGHRPVVRVLGSFVRVVLGALRASLSSN